MTDVPPPNVFGAAPPPPVWRRPGVRRAGAAALALLAAGGLGGAVGASMTLHRMAPSTAVSLPGTAGGTPSSFADVAAHVKPAVVSVHVEMRRAGNDQAAGPFGEFFRRFGGAAPPQLVEAAGSGFFISADGFIVTNNHVVENGQNLNVTLDDGRTLDARVVGRDPRTDLAVLKVDGDGFPFVRFAEHEPRIGDWVLAVGNPFGLGGTVTSGIVSARGRDIGAGPYDDFLQIDAPVNQGNSGGPTFNLAGEVVGVNTAIYSPSGGNVGIAFAIPAATATPIVDSLRRNGSVTRGYLGVAAQPVTPEIARSMGISRTQGALVAEVTAGSPAERAGLRPGDVITRVNDHDVEDARALARIVGGERPGGQAQINYLRGGEARSARVALTAQPAQGAEGAPGAPRTKPSEGAEGGNAALGVAVAPAAQAGAGAQGLAVVGVDPGGAAATRGVNVGDVIIEAGGHRLTQPSDLDSAVAEARRIGRNVLLLRVQSDQGVGYVAVPIGQG